MQEERGGEIIAEQDDEYTNEPDDHRDDAHQLEMELDSNAAATSHDEEEEEEE